jgi:hypothetical protein
MVSKTEIIKSFFCKTNKKEIIGLRGIIINSFLSIKLYLEQLSNVQILRDHFYANKDQTINEFPKNNLKNYMPRYSDFKENKKLGIILNNNIQVNNNNQPGFRKTLILK